jgi:hypothetical protein
MVSLETDPPMPAADESDNLSVILPFIDALFNNSATIIGKGEDGEIVLEVTRKNGEPNMSHWCLKPLILSEPKKTALRVLAAVFFKYSAGISRNSNSPFNPKN